MTIAKVATESDDPLAAAAKTWVEAENGVAFYGYEGLTYEETDALARMLGNLLLLKNEEGRDHVGRPNNGLIPVWPHNNTQGAWDMGVHPALAPGYKAVEEPGLDAAAIYAGANNGDIEALYVLGADPVGDGLMDGRGQLDFLVVQELFLTETARLADVVLPAQSWVEREGTFTSGERRVQRYYQAILPGGETRPDWQILAQVGERIGLGKPAFAASLVFREIARSVPQYKGMDYRSLAKVQKQWPDVGGEDLYYGGNAFENRSGLGQQWMTAVPDEPFEIPEIEVESGEGLKVLRVAALYTPGTLVRHSAVIAGRLARPALLLHEEDAYRLALEADDEVVVQLNGRSAEATVAIDEHVPEGVALLRGVPFIPGTAVAEINKIEEKEMVA